MTRLDRDGGGDLNRSLFFEGEREREQENVCVRLSMGWLRCVGSIKL